MKNLIIFGTGLIPDVLNFYFGLETEYNIVAFCEEQKFIKQKKFCSLPVISIEELAQCYPPSENDVFIGIGYKSHNRIRELRYNMIREYGYKCPTFISKKATYYNTPIGDNCFVFENNVIQPFSKIGNNVILWSGNHIGHHSEIQDHCFISSHVVISGNCRIGKNCFLGVNSSIHNDVTIGDYSVIGAGAVVSKSIPPHSLVLPEKSRIIEIKRNIL